MSSIKEVEKHPFTPRFASRAKKWGNNSAGEYEKAPRQSYFQNIFTVYKRNKNEYFLNAYYVTALLLKL